MTNRLAVGRLLLLSVALTSVGCATARPRHAPTAITASHAWTITMLGGECTLTGQGAEATAASCAALGSLDLHSHPASRRLGSMVASLESDLGEAAVGGWPAAQLAVAGAPPALVSDGWIPIARELKSMLRARPRTAVAPTPQSFYRWYVTTGDDTCSLAGHGAQVQTIDCPGVQPTAPYDLTRVTAWLRTAAIDSTTAGPGSCTLTTELAAPYPLAAAQCGELATILRTMAEEAVAPRDPTNKIDARALLAIAQLEDVDAPVVEVLIAWTAAPADRDRIAALGGVFLSTSSSSIQGVRMPLRALPAVAALAGVTSIELGQPLTGDVAR